LVGVYHAAYAGNTPLNVVVAIDQERDLMTTLKRSSRRERGEVSALDRKARTRLQTGLEGTIDPFFPFDGMAAVARPRSDGALVFEVMSPAFPVRSSPALVLEDLPGGAAEGYGELGRVWVGGRFGLKSYPRGSLDADAQALVERILDALRTNADLALELRTAQGQATRDREHYEHMGKAERQLRRAAGAQADLGTALTDLVERLSPKVGETTVGVAEAYAPVAAPPPGRNVAQGPGITEPGPQASTPAR
ncbi:MAG: hypothetical protein ACXWLS_06495, partial [Myxococcaceae bacterium]